MALDQAAIATQLAYNDGSARTITNIQGYTTNMLADELTEHRRGTARVPSHYRGKKDAFIRITSDDFAALALLTKGDYVTAVVLSVRSAVDSGGTAVGDNLTFTLSEAVIAEVTDISHDNENDAPATYEVEFRLSRDPSSGSDPTATMAADT